MLVRERERERERSNTLSHEETRRWSLWLEKRRLEMPSAGGFESSRPGVGAGTAVISDIACFTSLSLNLCVFVCVRVRVLGFWKREGRWFWKYKSYNKNSEKGFLICMISDLNQYVWEKDIYFKFGRVRNLNSNEGHGTLAVTLIFWTSLPSFSSHFFFLI